MERQDEDQIPVTTNVDGTLDGIFDEALDGIFDGTLDGTFDGTFDEAFDGTFDRTLNGTTIMTTIVTTIEEPQREGPQARWVFPRGRRHAPKSCQK